MRGSRNKEPTEAMMNKIKKANYSKFNKSVMILKMGSLEDKAKVLTPDTRLYGINFKDFKNVKFEEICAKPIVVITELPWGCSTEQV